MRVRADYELHSVGAQRARLRKTVVPGITVLALAFAILTGLTPAKANALCQPLTMATLQNYLDNNGGGVFVIDDEGLATTPQRFFWVDGPVNSQTGAFSGLVSNSAGTSWYNGTGTFAQVSTSGMKFTFSYKFSGPVPVGELTPLGGTYSGAISVLGSSSTLFIAGTSSVEYAMPSTNPLVPTIVSIGPFPFSGKPF